MILNDIERVIKHTRSRKFFLLHVYTYSSRYTLYFVKQYVKRQKNSRNRGSVSFKLIYLNKGALVFHFWQIKTLRYSCVREMQVTPLNAKAIVCFEQFQSKSIHYLKYLLWFSGFSLNKVYNNTLRNFHRQLCDIDNFCNW